MASIKMHCAHCGKLRWGRISSDGQKFMCYVAMHLNGLGQTVRASAGKVWKRGRGIGRG